MPIHALENDGLENLKSSGSNITWAFTVQAKICQSI